MNHSLKILFILLLISSTLLAQNQWKEAKFETYHQITNPNDGKILGYGHNSGVKILTVNGLAFKDLNKNGKLDKYEDWRLSTAERAKDLASKLSVEEIAGLMLYSSHQSVPARAGGYFAGTYGGKPFKEGEIDPSLLTDQQVKFLKEDHLRHVLLTTVSSPEIAAKWNNNLQSYCESIGFGIPANNSSDPRHGTKASAEYDAAAGGEISMWPSSLGLAATFDPSLVKRFGEIAAEEYRALGITTALSPQVDIATEPRWGRYNGTFGEGPKLSAAMGQAYCEGFQSDNWGFKSVNAMVKHWPGGGSGEAGRDAHYGSGKFAVYPGNNFSEHLIPFIDGAFKLKSKTQMASAVMPYYTISWNQDPKNNENVGNSYNKYLITDLLRVKYKYDGVVCTDWGITGDQKHLDQFIDGRSWGVDKLTVAERHYKILMAGVDQFGGNNDAKPIIEAYNMGVKEIGEQKMRARMEESAVRLLTNILNVGLFENPYVNPAETKTQVGKPEFMEEGYKAQLKSIVLLKNKNQALPIKSKKTVYVPKRFVPAGRNFLGAPSPETEDYPVNMNVVKKYYNVTDNPDEADFALVCIESPKTSIGYDKKDLEQGGNGYIPISLQYGTYTATEARTVSIAGGDPLESFTNRSYKNKTTIASNHTDAKLVQETHRKMKGKPVIVSVLTYNPMVFSEIEPYADAILINYGVQDQAILETIMGNAEPSARLPMQMPQDMITVENQAEDKPYDVKPYKDEKGNVYDFGFGLNWKGVIMKSKEF